MKCKLTWNEGIFTLSLGKVAMVVTDRMLRSTQSLKCSSFSDNSILEVYLNGGEEVFTSRIYNNQLDKNLSLVGTGYATLTK